MYRPTRQSHQPWRVPGPERTRSARAKTAAARTMMRTLRMESLRGHARVVQQARERREIRGLGEVVREARVERAAPVLLLPPTRDRDQHHARAPGTSANRARRVVAVQARHA